MQIIIIKLCKNIPTRKNNSSNLNLYFLESSIQFHGNFRLDFYLKFFIINFLFKNFLNS